MKARLITMFCIISIFIYIVLNYNKDARIERYLNNQTVKYSLAYKSIYNGQKDLAKMIKNLILSDKKIISIYKKLQTATKVKKDILRDELYHYVKDHFGKILNDKTTLLHFHLKDSSSFLRMHKPLKFGDNLEKIRPMIAYVNKNLIPIDGFEQGRIYDAYRFVYPIVVSGKHLGSMEISISADIIVEKFIENYQVIANFLVKKSLINKKIFISQKSRYMKSFYDEFYFDKKILDKIKKYNNIELNELLISKTNAYLVQKAALSNKTTTICLDGFKNTLTILPIKNPVTKSIEAFITIREKSQFMPAVYLNFRILFFILELLLAIALFSIYKQNQTNKSLELERDLVQSVLDAIPNITFVTDFKSVMYANSVFLNFFNVLHVKQFNKEFANILDIFLPWEDYLYRQEGKTKDNFIDMLINTDSTRRKVMVFNKYFSPMAFEILISKMRYHEQKSYLITLVDITEQETENKKIEHKAYYDTLTGVYNRNKFNELFEIEIKKAKRYKTSFCIAIIDIDHFKNFNDTYGHLVGDEVLKALAKKVDEHIRDTDVFARWGGEEFVTLFSETNLTMAIKICDKLRKQIGELEHKIAGHINASFGVTEYKQDDTMSNMFKRCDDALYMAKQNGRNRVESR